MSEMDSSKARLRLQRSFPAQPASPQGQDGRADSAPSGHGLATRMDPIFNQARLNPEFTWLRSDIRCAAICLSCSKAHMCSVGKDLITVTFK